MNNVGKLTLGPSEPSRDGSDAKVVSVGFECQRVRLGDR